MELEASFCSFNLEGKLKEIFGYNDFRAYQKEIIQAILAGKDVMAILPTGAGKSLCYQLPAMLLPGTAIVISPLISLMQDQVVSLYKNGIPAAFLNSSLHYQDIQDVLNHLADYKLLYVAPERLADSQFINRLKDIPLSFFVVDEAHCISQWGHSFRGEYRKLSVLKQLFPQCPMMALTATATLDVEKDIISQLAMEQPVLIKGSFDRPNLTIRIHPKIQPEKQVLEFIRQKSQQPGIIYAATRKGVESTFLQLQQAGFQVGRYHAGMTDQERSASQHAFLHDQVTLMVATVAFGMGVHKPDIRFIVHLDMPRTIEQYYQEIGRAGRDGLPAECLMLYGAQDLVIYKVFLEQLEDPSIRQQMKAKTDSMYRLCTSLDCRRKGLLKYFGEAYHSHECGTCDNCIDEDNKIDGTVIAQKILSCVFRMRQNVGGRLVIDVLRGMKNQAVLEKSYQDLSTYGLLADLSEAEVRYYIESLIQMGLIMRTEGQYPILKWTEKSKEVIEGRLPVWFKKKLFQSASAKPAPKRKEAAVLYYNEALFESLKQLRMEVAREEQVPPFVIFSDRALQEMATYFPQNQQDFCKINGVGPIKWIKYGLKFLEAVKAFTPASLPSKREDIRSPVQRQQSRQETVRLYQEGYHLEKIMESRQLARSTVITHLVEAIQQGTELDLAPLIPHAKQHAIKEAISLVGPSRLTPIKEKLPEDFTYEDIRLVAASYRLKESE
ncbi:DNA helicase RecQ [Candidatus Protochlamydia phocaeensis]|uniref:DNA helicase RecQ n=1 Tax=Candidatus Protochlamydia phocaeensis TaxID=1414722 RepID=UPI000839710E|nr:DNA helicase RecQ [Candidatus Protochlamydia phocaeensis]